MKIVSLEPRAWSIMGEVLTGEGLQVSKKRVEAIVDAPRPKNPSEVRSFLRSAQFCAKFIPSSSPDVAASQEKKTHKTTGT